MLSAKDKFTIALTVLASALLITVLTFSVMLAAFTQSKQATTTITFADGVVIEVSGIDGTTWTIDNNSTTVVAPFSFDPIQVGVRQGAGNGLSVHVRVFAIVYTNSSVALSAFGQTASNFTASETTEYNTVTGTDGTSKQRIALTQTFSSNSTTGFTTILNAYQPFNDLGANTMGSTVTGYVLIYATNTAPTDNNWDKVLGYTSAVQNLIP